MSELMPQLALVVSDPLDGQDVPLSTEGAVVVAMAIARAGHGQKQVIEELTRTALRDLDANRVRLSPRLLAVWRVVAVQEAAQIALVHGDFDGVWYWLVAGMGGDADGASATVDLTGLQVLLEDSVSGNVTAEDLLGYFSAPWFNIAVHAGYLTDILRRCDEPMLLALLRASPSDAVGWAVVQGLTWMRQQGKHSIVAVAAQWCWQAAKSRALSGDLRIELLYAAYFALPAGPERRKAFVSLYEALPTGVPPLIRLEVLLGGCEGDPIRLAVVFADVLAGIQAMWAEEARFLDPTALGLRRERMFNLVSPALRSLAESGHAGDCIRMARAWFGVPGEPDAALVETTVLLLDTDEGMRWCWEGGSHLMPQMSSLTTITDVINAARGSSLVTSGSAGRPSRRVATGDQDRSAGLALAAAARQYLDVNLPDQALGVLASKSLLLPLSPHWLPYQALIRERWNPPSLWSSLMAPRPDRWIDRLVFLEGETRLASTEFRLVSSLLGQVGCNITHVPTADFTADTLRRICGDDSFDAIWIAGHGLAPVFRPGDAHLVLPNGDKIYARDLQERPSSEGRRLLVVNTCDAGVTAVSGSPSQRGLAAAVASGSQAVVAHQWAVAEKSAALFGAALALHLMDNMADSRSAFSGTLGFIRRPWSDIRSALIDRGCATGDVDLLAPEGGELDNIFDYGSPAFLT
ncbi:CHAT domain-containing protein [Actinoplanes sp. NPDC049596]|uniref:CHAT domain-containing protein n=1 Tax=unclassified Actinoplanes TaxID=2626549 RepID=UPI00342E977A